MVESSSSSSSPSSLPPPAFPNSQSNATIRPPPPPRPGQSTIELRLQLTPLPELGPNIFTNTRPLWHPMGTRGIYGGAVLAQTLLAAQKTVPEGLYVHSFHCYFVLAVEPNSPIIYYVEDVRPARSFATREVKVKQKGKIVFVAIASFQRTMKKGDNRAVAEHQVSMPKGILGPEEAESDAEKVAKMGRQLEELRVSIDEKKKRDVSGEDKSIAEDELVYNKAFEMVKRLKSMVGQDPFIWRKASGSLKDHHPDTPIHERKVLRWVKSRDVIGGGGAENTANKSQEAIYNQLAALAYLSDSWFLGTVTRVNPQSRNRDAAMMVSLDHTIYFHLGEETKVDGDEWLLVETDSSWMGGERGLVTQRVWRKSDGRLVASCMQEGVVRLKDRKGGKEGTRAKSKL